ncbi:MAG: Crp/Fnr family transcriptional regulator [Acidobacteria bacterium]|nr:Crp/Fnr family transcriptional regulator [Acidobacteriota bacterium]
MAKAEQFGEMLKAFGLFASIPPGDLETLAKRFRWKRYEPGQQIISHLEESTDVYFVMEGSVRVIVYSPMGMEVTFRDIAAGEYFGELAAIDGLPRSATVTSVSGSLVGWMSAEIFRDILRSYPDVAASVMRQLVSSVRSLTERVFEFSTLAVKNRVHAELLRLARHHMVGGNAAMIRPAPRHAELASRISTHREAVTRELNQLSRDGLVERKPDGLAIHDVGLLARLVQNVVGH